MGYATALMFVLMAAAVIGIPIAFFLMLVVMGTTILQAKEAAIKMDGGMSESPASSKVTQKRTPDPEPEIMMCPKCKAICDERKVCKCGTKTKVMEEVMAEDEEWI